MCHVIFWVVAYVWLCVETSRYKMVTSFERVTIGESRIPWRLVIVKLVFIVISHCLLLLS